MAKLHDADAAMAKQLYNELNLKDKIIHFWVYHRKKVFTAIFLIMVAGMAYVLRPIPTPVANLRIMFVNAYIAELEAENNILIEDYERHLGENNTCEIALSYCVISPEDKMRENANIEKVMSEVTKWNIELFVFDEYAMNMICPTGFIRGLNTCMEHEVLEKVQDRLVYYNDLEGNNVPMAINITDSQYAEKVGIQGDDVYIAFAMNSPNEEMVKQFVTYILSTI